MKMRIVWSGLVAGAVILATGTVMGSPPGIDNLLVDFNQATSELSAYPLGGALTTYVHQSTTVHLPGNLFGYTPPDPCRPLAEAWNLTVEYDAKRKITSTFVFEELLALMGDFQCHASVSSTLSGGTQVLIQVTPTAN